MRKRVSQAIVASFAGLILAGTPLLLPHLHGPGGRVEVPPNPDHPLETGEPLTRIGHPERFQTSLSALSDP